MVPRKDISHQLLRLFVGAGLVEQATLAKYADKFAKSKTILDIMNEEVSLESFRNLLTAEVSFKRKGTRLERDLFKGLSATGMINDAELKQVLAQHRPPRDRLIEALRRDKVIDETRAQQLAGQTRTAGEGVDEGPAPEEIVSADSVCQWLSTPDSRQFKHTALLLTLQFFRHNELIQAAELKQLTEALGRNGHEHVIGQLRQKVDLSVGGLNAFLERDLSVPAVELETTEIDPRLMDLFPQSLIRRQMFIPYRRDGVELALALVDPFNVMLIALLEWATGRRPQAAFAPAMRIVAKINAHYDSQKPPAETEGRRPAAPAAPAAEPARESAAQTWSRETGLVADNISAVQLVSSLIESAIDLRTTDIHIEPTREGLTVRFRIDGELHRIMAVPAAMSQAVTSRVKVLADMDVTERRRPQDGHFELALGERNFDFRISTLPALLGEKIVIRILDSSQVMSELETLGLLKEQREDFEWMLGRPYGMILTTGPTGSGKTSTLYSGLHRLNSEKRNLVTIEDPVEYQLEGINQVQVDANIDVTFAQGLRSILRQDPDVIMVGEIRDGTTAQIAIRAAMTGHLVLSTLHTNSALGAIDALVNLGAVRFMVSNSLLGILNQRLLRKLCEQCKRPMNLSDEIRKEFGIDDRARKRIRKPAGCKECLGTGYMGRTAVFEVIKITDHLRTLIAEHRPEELERAVREAGIMDLQQAAVRKILDGVTSIDEVRGKIMLEF